MPEFAGLNFDVSRETLERIEHYESLILKWTKRINLVSKSTLNELRDRHIVDSAQIFPLLPPNAAHLADFGSGGGLPAVVLATLAKQHRPELKFSLVESDLRKATFLRQCSREMDLGLDVHSCRAEDLGALNADVISARALAPLGLLLELTFPHMAEGAVALFPKGQKTEEELAQVQGSWSFDLERFPSQTSPDSTILRLQRIARA